MKILVCIKQVPDTTEVRLDPKTGTLIRDGVPSIINHDDKAGLEAALTPERVVVSSDSLYMHFEPGVISEDPTGYAFNADMGTLKDLMYDWAVPVKQD